MEKISNSKKHKINFLIDNWMNNYYVPNCNISIYKNNKQLLSQSYSKNNISSVDTIYNICSCTKSMTAIGILQLCQKNFISLDDDITQYISVPSNKKISIHNLLSHSSGMPSDGLLTEILNQKTKRRYSNEKLTNHCKFINYSFTYYDITDNKFRYYNTGYILLGKIIEKITNNSYEDYIQKNILDKLNITNFYFSHNKEKIKSNNKVAEPYLNKEKDIIKSDFYYEKIINPAGGLFISIPDLCKYVKYHGSPHPWYSA